MRVTRPRLRRGWSRSDTGRIAEGRGLFRREVDDPFARPQPCPALVEEGGQYGGPERTAEVWPQLCPVWTGAGEGTPRAARRLQVHARPAQGRLARLGQPEVAALFKFQPALVQEAVEQSDARDPSQVVVAGPGTANVCIAGRRVTTGRLHTAAGDAGSESAQGREGHRRGLAPQGVDTVSAAGLALDHPRLAEQGQVCGDTRLLQVQAAGKVADGRLTHAESVDQTHTALV